MKEINYAKWEETLMLDVIPEEGLKISAWTGFGELLGFKVCHLLKFNVLL